MTDSAQPASQKLDAEDELDYLFANASPNPNREGCPSREELRRVSRLEKPIGDASYTHIVRCSPCFREMRALQQESATRSSARMWAVAAAAVVVLIVGGSWWIAGSPNDAALVATTIDLRPFAVMRGDTQAPPPAPIVIPRGRLSVTIVLPLGAEAGIYELRLHDNALLVRATASGTAELRDSVTTLRVQMETAAIPAGPYRLAIRRGGGEWLNVPARLK